MPLRSSFVPSSGQEFGIAGAPEWRVVVLVEIINFVSLRRIIGRGRSELLAARIGERAAAHLQPVAWHVAGQASVELDLLGSGPADIEQRLTELERAFSAMIDLDGDMHHVELALAAAAGPAIAGADGVHLIEQAEAALAQAKGEGRRIVREVRHDAVADGLPLREELAQAIASDQLCVQYQPKLHVRRQEVASAEALIRWRHPIRGMVYPGDFIAFAEKSGLIRSLTLWTLRRVIDDQLSLRNGGHDLTIFVNISGQLLGDRDFIDEACAMISMAAARIGFEITETSMIGDPRSAIAHLQIVAKHGVPIAIDDYGAGLSSLAYLKQLPAIELKIDKMFVMELTSSHRDPLIVRSTIDLAHALEMEVTAEGVETPAALALLSVMGCDLVQGFLLSRPLSLPDFQAYLRSEAVLPAVMSGHGFARPALRRSR